MARADRHSSRKAANSVDEGNPPTVQTWINKVKFMEFKDTEKRHADTGSIALQVHGGGDYTKQFVGYKNVCVKVLKKWFIALFGVFGIGEALTL